MDVFDAASQPPTKPVGDVFDQAAQRTQGDVFDQAVSANSTQNGDVFDQAAAKPEGGFLSGVGERLGEYWQGIKALPGQFVQHPLNTLWNVGKGVITAPFQAVGDVYHDITQGASAHELGRQLPDVLSAIPVAGGEAAIAKGLVKGAEGAGALAKAGEVGRALVESGGAGEMPKAAAEMVTGQVPQPTEFTSPAITPDARPSPIPAEANPEDYLTKGTVAKVAGRSGPDLGDELTREAAAQAGPKRVVPWATMDAQRLQLQADVERLMTKPRLSATETGALFDHAANLQDNVGILRAQQLDAIKEGNADLADQLDQQASDLTSSFNQVTAKASHASSAMGRELNYLKQNALPTSYEGFLAKAWDQKGAPLTDMEQAALRRFIPENGTTADVDGALRFIRGLRPTTTLERIEQGWKDFLISGLGTAGVIGVSAPVYNLFGLLTKPARMLLSRGLSAFTGVDTDLSLGQLRGEAIGRGVQGAVQDVREVSKGITPKLGGNETPFGVSLEAQPFKDVPIIGPFAQLFHNVITRTHTGLHRLIAEPVYQSAITERAIAIAKAEGLTGSPMYERAAALIQSPSDEMQAYAINRTGQATFLNENFLSKRLGALQYDLKSKAATGVRGLVDWRNYANAALTYTVPFSRISGNLIARGAELTPVGGVATISDALKLYDAVRAGAPKSAIMDLQSAFTRHAINAVGGTAGIYLMGYMLHKDGLLTGAEPQSPEEKLLWDAQGRGPYMLSLDGGKTWHNTRVLGPMSIALNMGAQTHQMASDPTGSVAENLMKGTVGGLSAAAKESFLENLGDIADTFSGKEGGATNLLRHAKESLTPSIVREVQRATDPYTRDENGNVRIGQGGTPLVHETGIGAFLPTRGYPSEPAVRAQFSQQDLEVGALQADISRRMADLKKEAQAVEGDPTLDAATRFARRQELEEKAQHLQDTYQAQLNQIRSRQ